MRSLPAPWHCGKAHPPVDRQMSVKTLPSHNFVCRRYLTGISIFDYCFFDNRYKWILRQWRKLMKRNSSLFQQFFQFPIFAVLHIPKGLLVVIWNGVFSQKSLFIIFGIPNVLVFFPILVSVTSTLHHHVNIILVLQPSQELTNWWI